MATVLTPHNSIYRVMSQSNQMTVSKRVDSGVNDTVPVGKSDRLADTLQGIATLSVFLCYVRAYWLHNYSLKKSTLANFVLGTISVSFYLLHHAYLLLLARPVQTPGFSPLATLAVALLLAGAFALIAIPFFQWFEQPFMYRGKVDRSLTEGGSR